MKIPTVLVTGATGTVGRDLVGRLAQCDCRVRVAARTSEVHHRRDSAETVFFDFTDPSSYGPALSGVDALFLLRPPAISNVDTFIAPVVRAARTAGVSRIVFLSIQGVETKPWVPHHKIEKCIAESGVAYTFLRCGFFMQNLATTHRDEIRDDDEIVVPAGRSVTAFVDTRDIAEVAASELLYQYHTAFGGVAGEGVSAVSPANRIFALTGPAAITYEQAASALSRVLGRTIRYRSPNVVSFLLRQQRTGKPWRFAFVMTMLYIITRFGNASVVAPDIENLLGRPATSFEQFVLDYRSSWEPAGDSR